MEFKGAQRLRLGLETGDINRTETEQVCVAQLG